jgi:hypothetical protein
MYTKIQAYVLVPKSFMKFMFSTVYRETQKDFYAHSYISMWAPPGRWVGRGAPTAWPLDLRI